MRQPGTQHHRGHRRRPRAAAVVRVAAAAVGAPDAAPGSLADHPRRLQRHPGHDADHAGAGRRRHLPVPAQRLGDADSGAGAALLDPRHVRRDADAALQPQQPVDDGAHPLDRLRRRRRDRDAREHRAPHGGGRDAARGGAQGLAGDRLHDPDDDHVAGGGVHPDSLHERHPRPAVPRVRGHDHDRDSDLRHRVGDADADAVQPLPARRPHQEGLRRADGPRLRRAAARLRVEPGARAAPPRR